MFFKPAIYLQMNLPHGHSLPGSPVSPACNGQSFVSTGSPSPVGSPSPLFTFSPIKRGRGRPRIHPPKPPPVPGRGPGRPRKVSLEPGEVKGFDARVVKMQASSAIKCAFTKILYYFLRLQLWICEILCS